MELVTLNEKNLVERGKFLKGSELVSKNNFLLNNYLNQFSESTQTSYRNCLRLFFNKYENVRLYKLEPQHVREYLTVHFKDKSPSYKKFTKTILLSFFDYLIVENCIRVNPARPVRLPKVSQEKNRFDVPTEEEVYRIIDYLEFEYHKVLVEMLYLYGLRISEALKLRLSDFKFKESYYSALFVGKGGKIGEVRISKEFYSKLQNIERIDSSGPLFPSPRNKSRSITREGFSKELKKAVLKAKIKKDISPHKFRHATADEMIKDGRSLANVQSYLRHSSPSTTMRYSDNKVPDLMHESLERKVRNLNEVSATKEEVEEALNVIFSEENIGKIIYRSESDGIQVIEFLNLFLSKEL